MILTKMALPRRTFLRGAGAAIGLPLLDAMVPAATALARTPAKPVHRLGYFHVPNGMSQPYWNMEAGKNPKFSPTISVLEPHREYVTVLSGLNNYEATKGSGGGVHTRAWGAYMCGALARPTEGSDAYLARTADSYAAEVLGAETPIESLELAINQKGGTVGNCEYNYSCLYQSTISWRSPTEPNPVENNPRVIFERLFGDESDPAARALRRKRDKSILDQARQQLNGLQATLGGSDRAALDQYLQSIRDVERRIQKSERQNATSVELIDRPMGIPNNYVEHVEITMDLLYLAFQADLTRVSTMTLAANNSYPWIGVSEDHHELSHHQNNPIKLEKVAKINAHHLSLFGRLVEKMKQTKEGDGTLLDHAMLMYGASMSDGDLHSPLEIPLVLVGHGNGTLKGNRHIVYSPKDKVPMANLHLTMLDRVGVRVDKMADSTGHLTDFS